MFQLQYMYDLCNACNWNCTIYNHEQVTVSSVRNGVPKLKLVYNVQLCKM